MLQDLERKLTKERDIQFEKDFNGAFPITQNEDIEQKGSDNISFRNKISEPNFTDIDIHTFRNLTDLNE